MFNEMNDSVPLNHTNMAIHNTESVSNFSLLIATEFMDVETESDPEYEQFLADVWVGIVLTLMVLSCVCCMCSCLLYHKFQQWKRSVIEARQASEIEAGYHEADTLPSYTIASGLPSYAEALEQLKIVKELTKGTKGIESNTPPVGVSTSHRLSITELFQLYRSNSISNPSVSKS